MIHRFITLLSVLAVAASPALAQGGFLGVSLEPAPEGVAGARISEVQERSAASIMGLQAGDLVTALDGMAVADPAALAALIRTRLPGEIVELDVQRAGSVQKVLGVLARRPEAFRIRAPQMGQPGQMAVPEREAPFLEIPEIRMPEFSMPGFEFPELQFPFPEFPRQHEQMLQEFQDRWEHFELRGLPGGQGFSFRFEDAPDGLGIQPGAPLQAGDGTRIRLRYPEDTTPDARERLRQGAIAKYGEKVEVEFAGSGTSLTIERHRRGIPHGEPPAPSTPSHEENREF